MLRIGIRKSFTRIEDHGGWVMGINGWGLWSWAGLALHLSVLGRGGEIQVPEYNRSNIWDWLI
jgi:hypothetical protein